MSYLWPERGVHYYRSPCVRPRTFRRFPPPSPVRPAPDLATSPACSSSFSLRWLSPPVAKRGLVTQRISIRIPHRTRHRPSRTPLSPRPPRTLQYRRRQMLRFPTPHQRRRHAWSCTAWHLSISYAVRARKRAGSTRKPTAVTARRCAQPTAAPVSRLMTITMTMCACLRERTRV